MNRLKRTLAAALFALLGCACVLAQTKIAPVLDDGPPLSSDRPVRVEGELLVKFRGGPKGTAARSSASKLGHTVKRDFEHIGWQQIQLPPGLSVDEALARYQQDPDVLAAEPNYRVQTEQPLTTAVPVSLPKRAKKDDLDPVLPNDPLFPQQWGLSNICAPQAWAITTGSTNVVVAVLDTGVNYLHEDLVPNMWHNPLEIPGNGIDDDGNGYVDDVYGADTYSKDGDPMDEVTAGYVYHGTGCAGIIGAVGNNGIGLAGLNWHVRIMGVRFNNGDTWWDWANGIAGLNYILGMRLRGENLRTVNMSFGWSGQGGYSQALKDAIDALGNAGVVSVIAAGNRSEDIDATPFYPAALASPHIVSVAASTPSDRLADFSDWGRTNVDLAAPGAETTNIIMASGPTPTSYTSFWGGTSSATPYVAGAVALLASAYPEATVTQLKAAILGSVDLIEPFQGMMVTGGRLNVARALLHLSTNQPPVFVIPPQSKFVFLGGSFSLAAGAGGTPPLAYQWFQGSNTLAGATNALLTFTNLLASQTGLWVQVGNAFGTATSSTVQVTVDARVPLIAAWGAQPHGQCEPPLDVTDLVAVAGGRWHSLGLRSDGTVLGWGSDQDGTSIPSGIGKAMAIAAGWRFSMALLSNGTVRVWGRSVEGETNVPSGLAEVASIAAGQLHCLALKSNGTVVAWGWNTVGQCNVPGDLTEAAGVSGGYKHSLAVLRNGAVRAWGNNTSGQCNVPGGLRDVASVVAGFSASLALKRDGTLVAWGGNPNGELNIPTGLSNVVAITGYTHFMALKRDGTVVAWGAGMTDQKTGLNWGQAIVPLGLTNVIAIGSNGRHSLALRAQPPPPAIAIQNQGANTFISWPESAAGWQLLSASNLAPLANWQPWSAPLFTNQGSVFTPITPNNTSRFFRLRSP